MEGWKIYEKYSILLKTVLIKLILIWKSYINYKKNKNITLIKFKIKLHPE
jgi:hypothetical protein